MEGVYEGLMCCIIDARKTAVVGGMLSLHA